MKTLTVLLFLVFVLNVSAQNETNHWFWGMGQGLDFSGGLPVPETGSPAMWCNEGSAAISDRITGNLLFYTDGMVVFDATHMPMPNGYGLTGNTSSSQSALIVPMPLSDHLYYVFTNDCFECTSTMYGCRYSVVDMSLNGGLGDVVVGSKNILLFHSNSEQLSAIRHANCTDWWIMTKEAHNNVYRAYLLTSIGLTGPVVSTIGLPVSTFAAGQAKFSPSGSKYAISTDGYGIIDKGICQLFDFDNNTGLLSNPMTLIDSTANENTYGLAFSPDNSKLYVTRGNMGGSKLYQFDLSSGVLATITSTATYLGIHGQSEMQLAKDGKIYLAASWLGAGFEVINNPNITGIGCNYGPSTLPVFQSGICNFPDSYFTTPCPMVASVNIEAVSCYGDHTGSAWVTRVSNNIGPYTVSWSPGEILNDTIDNLNAGTYIVTITDSSGQVYIDTVVLGSPAPVTVNVHPTASITSIICLGGSIALTAMASGGTEPYDYNWSTGDTTASINASLTASGNVYVTVTDSNGCSGNDSIAITVLPAPDLIITGDTCLCAGQSLTLSASLGSGFTWNTGDHTASITVWPLTDTVYWVSMTIPCVFSDTVSVCVHPVPALEAYGDTTIHYPNTTTLHAHGDGALNWSPPEGLSCTACGSPVAQPDHTTLYLVTATNIYGCTTSDSVWINVIGTLEIPNIVTPNGDGINDVFKIKGLPDASTLYIFNRWGNRVFFTSNYQNDWSVAIDGVYYYVLNTPDGKTFNGFIQVSGH